MHVRAGDGFLGIDHELDLDQRGIWARKYQVGLEFGVIATEIGGSLWLGNDDELGHTLWQTIDSTAISSVAAEALKFSFSRARPNQGNNPNQWFKGRCCDSFPSGEVTLQASFVTPFIANYARDYPWVWSLELLPAYDALARLEEPGALADRCHCRMGVGFRGRLLGDHRAPRCRCRFCRAGYRWAFTRNFEAASEDSHSRRSIDC